MDKRWNEYNGNSWTFCLVILHPLPPLQMPSVRQQTVQGSICVNALNRVPCFPTNTPLAPQLMATWWLKGGENH